jgi:hypothetical protein
MKIFVRDHGWEGATMYVSDSRETAVEYFRNIEIDASERAIAQHDIKKNGIAFVNRERQHLECLRSKDYDNSIFEYDCVEGNIFYTEGE